MNLTENEIIILKASRTNNFCDAVEDDTPWVFAVIDESHLDPKVARGTISSLVKKGLVIVFDYEGRGRANDMCFTLTDEGKKVTIELTETSEAGEVQVSQSITPEFHEFAIQNRFTPDLASNRMELDSPENYANGEYHSNGVLLMDMDSLDIWSFSSEADATNWLKDELLCCEGHKLMAKLPIDVQVWAIKKMPDQVWDCDKDWWIALMFIVASNYSTEIGVNLWTEVNELLGRLRFGQ